MTKIIFSDGKSLIKAYTTANPLIGMNRDEKVGQKWQVWKRANHGSDYVSGDKWEEFLQKKDSFSNTEEFWKAYYDINSFEFGLTDIACDYYVFKYDIKPMWEDVSNRSGGRWVMEFEKKRGWKHITRLDDVWLKVLLGMTEKELVPYMKDICGAVLMIRSHVCKIAVWTADFQKVLTNLNIGVILRSYSGFDVKITYERHNSKLRAGRPPKV